MQLAFEIREDMQTLSGLGDRQFSRVFKQALVGPNGGLAFWRNNFLRSHFMHSAYTWYAGEYGRFKKKRKGLPLVSSGNLRSRVLNAGNARISGTANGARIRILYGAPAQYRGYTVHKRIEKMLRENPRMKKKDAWRAVLTNLQEGQEATLARKVIYLMKERKLTKQQAEWRVYAPLGYPDEMREAFRVMLTAVNAPEERRITDHIWKEVVKGIRSKPRRALLEVR